MVDLLPPLLVLHARVPPQLLQPRLGRPGAVRAGWQRHADCGRRRAERGRVLLAHEEEDGAEQQPRVEHIGRAPRGRPAHGASRPHRRGGWPVVGSSLIRWGECRGVGLRSCSALPSRHMLLYREARLLRGPPIASPE
jgi:hypothetical protein